MQCAATTCTKTKRTMKRMTKILLCGCFGKMGRVIADVVSRREDVVIAAGVDVSDKEADFPTWHTPAEVTEPVDAIIDFSHPSALEGILDFALKNRVPAVLATTGYTDAQIAQIKAASASIPVFFSFNMSLGINLLVELSKRTASILGDSFDIEIVEAHHNQKIDAPSGTAVMLADGINEALDSPCSLVYDRHDRRKKREKKEIGMHAIRGGTIVGEHQVIFAGRDEIITLSHSARSKEVFAVGAVSAAVFMHGKAPGLYNMKDLIAAS